MIEFWDIYDKNRVKTGCVHERGITLNSGEYHLVVIAWLKGIDGRFLISRRSGNKIGANKWETVGGSALVGESSEEAVVREISEEVGLSSDHMSGRLVTSIRYDENNRGWFGDYWLYEGNIDIDEVVCQEGEVSEVRWASRDEIIELISSGEFFNGSIHMAYLFSTELM